ncbi:hypothetical protein ACSVDA_01415 [Cytobacillus sp. Hm23]
MVLAYVVNNTSPSGKVIDVKNHNVIATVPVGIGSRAISFMPDGKLAYIVNSGNFRNNELYQL